MNELATCLVRFVIFTSLIHDGKLRDDEKKPHLVLFLIAKVVARLSRFREFTHSKQDLPPPSTTDTVSRTYDTNLNAPEREFVAYA
jgi:hypothetical protein